MIIRWADVFHFEDIAAFGASSDGAVAGHLLWGKEEGLEFGLFPLGERVMGEGRRAYCQPDDDVGVYWIACTAGVLLVSK